MQRPLTLALVLAGVFFLGMIVGYTHVQPEQFEASQPLRQPRGGAARAMTRYKGRISTKAIEQAYPHIVQMIVPLGGFGKKLDEMYEWHRARGIQDQTRTWTTRREWPRPHSLVLC